MRMNLAKTVEKLRKRRDYLQAEMERIDATLAGIREALGMGVQGPGRAAVASAASDASDASAASAPKAARRKRRTFAVNGLQSVLNFVKENKNATTATINANWSAEGRAGRADVTLGKLVAEKKLKRVKLKGERGSRYQVA